MIELEKPPQGAFQVFLKIVYNEKERSK